MSRGRLKKSLHARRSEFRVLERLAPSSALFVVPWVSSWIEEATQIIVDEVDRFPSLVGDAELVDLDFINSVFAKQQEPASHLFSDLAEKLAIQDPVFFFDGGYASPEQLDAEYNPVLESLQKQQISDVLNRMASNMPLQQVQDSALPLNYLERNSDLASIDEFEEGSSAADSSEEQESFMMNKNQSDAVSDNTQPEQFNVDFPSQAFRGQDIVFTVNSLGSSGGVSEYLFDFGNGQTYFESETNAPDGAFDGKTIFSYDKTGNYQFKLFTSTSAGGGVDLSLKFEQEISILPELVLNDAPEANDDNYAVNEDNNLTVNAASGVLANDLDIDSTYTISAFPSGTTQGGSIALNVDGSFVYGPKANFNGVDSFTYTISDGTLTDTATAFITVGTVNDAPDAKDDNYTMLAGEYLSVSDLNGVLENDSDLETGFLISGYDSSSFNGGYVELFSDGSFEYSSPLGFTGVDKFVYTIQDDDGSESSATVFVTVNPKPNTAPNALGSKNITTQNKSFTFLINPNDNDPDGDSLEITSVSSPSNGLLSKEPDGRFTYTPNKDFVGLDSFVYQISDGNGGFDTALVNVEVTLQNKIEAVDDIGLYTNFGNPLFISVLNNDYDPDALPGGESFSITSIQGMPLGLYASTNTPHGTVYNYGTAIYYVPSGGYVGQESFTYTITDSLGAQDTATVQIRIGNTSPLAVDDFTSTKADTAVTVFPLLDNGLGADSDLDGDKIFLSGIKINPSNGSLVLNPDGSVVYIPNKGFSGKDSFVYELSDSFSSLSGTYNYGTVNIEIASNSSLDALNNIYKISEDTALKGFNVLANDFNPTGGPVILSSVGNPLNGSLAVNGDGSFDYKPNENYFGVDSFSYKITDGKGNFDTASVLINITPVNDPVEANNDGVMVAVNSKVTINPLFNDIDAENDKIILVGVTNPSFGNLVVNANLTVTYTPNLGYGGKDSFTYTVTDGYGVSDTATVFVGVGNIAPDAVNDSVSGLSEGGPAVNINVLQNDSDANPEDTLKIVEFSQARGGLVTLNSNQTFTYTPAADTFGVDRFIYKVTDGYGGFDTATVVLTIAANPDAPVAVDDKTQVLRFVPSYGGTYGPPAGGFYSFGTGWDAIDVVDVTSGTILKTINLPTNTFSGSGNVVNDFASTSPIYVSPDQSKVYVSNAAGAVWVIDTKSLTIVNTITGTGNIVEFDASSDGKYLQGITGNTGNGVVGYWGVTKIDLAQDKVVDTLSLAFPYTFNGSSYYGGSMTDVEVDPHNSNVYATRIIDSNAGVNKWALTIFDNATNIKVADIALSKNPSSVFTGYGVEISPDGKTAYALERGTNFVDVIDLESQKVVGNFTLPDTTDLDTVVFNKDGGLMYGQLKSAWNGSKYVTSSLFVVDTKMNVPIATIDVSLLNDAVADLELNKDGSVLYVKSAPYASNNLFITKYTGSYNFLAIDTKTHQIINSSFGVNANTPNLVPGDLSGDTVNASEYMSVRWNTTNNILQVIQNDYDPDGQPLEIVSVTNPSNGTISFTPANSNPSDNNIFYTPKAGFSGLDSFTYTIRDTSGLTSKATVYLNVISSNNPPVAGDDYLTTFSNEAVTSNVLGNDSDLDKNSLSVSSISSPAHGSVVINGDNSITYTPDKDYFGLNTGPEDSFVYTVSDGLGGFDTATVFIDIAFKAPGMAVGNTDPDALDDNFTVNENESIILDVLINDFDLDGHSLKVVEFQQPSAGYVSLNSDQTLTYVSTANSKTPILDTFVYKAHDGFGGIDVATVTVTVQPVNDPPNANSDSLTLNEDSQKSLNVLLNDTDAEGDSLVLDSVTQGQNGSVGFTPEGLVTYTPKANFYGFDNFTYTVSDGKGGLSSAYVNVTVKSVIDSIQVVNDSYTMKEDDGSLVLDVLANDLDVDKMGVLSGTSKPLHGIVTINPDNTISYTPNTNFFGTDQFSYTLSAGAAGTQTGYVQIAVTPVNDLPTLLNDSYKVAEDESLTINISSVMANDYDADGDVLALVSVSDGQNGSVIVENNKLIYTPQANFPGTNVAGGIDFFTYTVSDGVSSALATVFVNVTPVNDAPIAVVDFYDVLIGQEAVLNVIDNDLDLDADLLEVVSVDSMSQFGGQLIVNLDNTITYKSALGFSGMDYFAYTVEDGYGGQSKASVTVNVLSFVIMN